MAARIQTEKDVLGTAGVRGMVVRPGLVYGHGASYDIPGLIAMARANGAAPHLGQGALLQGYVHVDDLQSYIDSLLSTVKRARLFTAQRTKCRSVTSHAQSASLPVRANERTVLRSRRCLLPAALSGSASR